ncbi:MAG: hypothetical protein HOV77_25295 [Hamadaea sp.]|uniref:hypothetical protein n=1 Tax=Hamadaea sp. TaxID=2024425 RepID=UPI00182DC0AD|nr:hypothetical protein [Hamadaea sp.]NUT22501.1 hypothetical protein [Hamadaea sp.]
MSVRLPRSVLITLVTLGTLLLALSVYLELCHLELLSRHPILVNLLSGMVGFCFGVVALSAVLASVLDGAQRREANAALSAQLTQCTAKLQRMLGSLDAGPSKGHGLGRLYPATARMIGQVWLYSDGVGPFAMSLHPQALAAASDWVGVWEGLVSRGGVPVASEARGEIERCRASLNASTRQPTGAMAAKLLDDLGALADRCP